MYDVVLIVAPVFGLIALGFLLALRRARVVGVDRARVAQLGVTVVVSGFLVAHFVHVLAYDPGLFRERAPPNVHGPPIFIRNCSFLN